MTFIWDYDIKQLQKTESGRIKILERQINYGVYPSENQSLSRGEEKISLRLVKKHWTKLQLEQKRKRLFELLIWGK